MLFEITGHKTTHRTVPCVMSQADSPVPGIADAIGLVIGIAATVVAGIMAIPWDKVGRSISYAWNKAKNIVKTAAITLSISKQVVKTKAKIKTEKKRYDYWIAQYIDFGNDKGTFIATIPIAYSTAISLVRAGKSVFADSRSNAYRLAKAVGNGRAPAHHPPHGGVGYFKHYMATNRKGKTIGGHVFYV